MIVQELEKQHEEFMQSQDTLAQQQEKVLEEQARQIASLSNGSASIDALVETAVPAPRLLLARKKPGASFRFTFSLYELCFHVCSSS